MNVNIALEMILPSESGRLITDSLPFHGVSVHFLFVVKQTVGCACDRNGGVQAQRLSCSQNQLALQL